MSTVQILVNPAGLSLADVTSLVGTPLALAFGAGVLSTLNPCGLALLPAYVSYTLGHTIDHQPTGWEHLLRGGLLGLPLAVGFLLVFLVAGGVLALGGRVLVHVFPWLALLVGTGLILLGGWTLLTRRSLEIPGLGAVMANVGKGGLSTSATVASSRRRAFPDLRAAWIFGLGYGLSSLGCTLPVFLLVIGTAITTAGTGEMLLVLFTYAAGMTLVLLAVALMATTLADVLRQTVFPLLRWVQPVASLLLVGTGIYIVFYQLHTGLW